MNKASCGTAVAVFVLLLTLAGCLTQPIVGAYTVISRDDDAALEACAFLREELASSHPEIVLGGIKRASRQVVAGYNVRLQCRYRTALDTSTRTLVAIIYFDLEGERRLTSLVLDEKDRP
jgi:hypothetical protein